MPIEKIDHIGIAVRDMKAAMASYDSTLGLATKIVEEHPEMNLNICFIPVGGTLVEFLEPNGEAGDIFKFLEKRGEGIHHIAYRVDDIDAELAALKAKGVRLINETAVDGGGGSRVAFIHPKSTNGILTELVERKEEI